MIEVVLAPVQEMQLRRAYIQSDYYTQGGRLRGLNMDIVGKYSYKKFAMDTIPGVVSVNMMDNQDYIYALTFRDKESLLMFTLRYP